VITAILGIIALGATMIGYMKYHSTVIERIATGVAAACLITPESHTDYIGGAILLAVFLIQMFRKRRIIGNSKQVSNAKWEVSNDG
jgi:TRAP-type uncharacterized transport system fused permease subunit